MQAAQLKVGSQIVVLESLSLVTERHYLLIESYWQNTVVLLRQANLLIPYYEQLLINGSLFVALTHLIFSGLYIILAVVTSSKYEHTFIE